MFFTQSDETAGAVPPAAAAGSLGLWARLARERAGQWLQPLHGRLRPPAMTLARGNASLVMPMPAPLRRLQGRGEDICRGHWVLAGHEARAAGAVIFDHHEAPAEWLLALHAFDWLHELLQQPRRLWLLRARSLVLDWLQRWRARQLPALALQPAVTARRVVNWAGAAMMLLEGTDAGHAELGGDGGHDERAVGNRQAQPFARVFVQGLAAQARVLQRASLRGLTAAQRLEVVMARAFAALALEPEMAARRHALASLAAEMERQFLADGGHVSRCAQVHLDLLCTLLPLRRAVMQAGMEVPAALEQALQRALPWLRMLAHADGGLALFHGGRDAERQLLARVLEHDAVAGAPLRLAPQSGYARLSAGEAVALVDVGAPPPPWDNPAAALSPLALEFSVAGQRIITSCGTPYRAVAELREAARLSAAHSMPMLDGADAGELLDDSLSRWLAGAAVACGPMVRADVGDDAQGQLLEAEHDAWRASHGLLTRRRLFLAAGGDDLRGEDAFLPAPDMDGKAAVGEGALPFVIRFHLHPGVKASISRDGLSVMLVLPDRTGWVFTARNARLALEEGVLLAGSGGPRRSVQIVLRGEVPVHTGCTVNWRLRRMAVENGGGAERRKRRARQRQAQEAMLFD